MFWQSLKYTKVDLGVINKASTEFGVEQDTNGPSTGGPFNLSDLTLLDPTGLSSMVMSFTKYGSCNSADFSVDHNELNFGNISGSSTLNIVLTAQRPTTITRIVSPALSNCSITPIADCISKQLLPGQSCIIEVQVNSSVNLDSELRIYTNSYSNVPFPIHILANSSTAAQAQTVPNVDEGINNTSIAGVWVMGNDETEKVIIASDGSFSIPFAGVNGSVVAAGTAGRAFAFSTNSHTQTLTLSQDGNFLSEIPFGQAIEFANGNLLDVSGASNAADIPLINWPSNGGLNQWFNFVPQTDGTYQIIAFSSGQALTVKSNSNQDGANVVTWAPNSDTGERFTVEPAGDGTYFRIISAESGLTLGVQGNSSQTGLPIVQSAWVNSPAQRVNRLSGVWIRRPWDAGCNPGEVNFDGLCYDVAPGTAMTSPGIVGKLCPSDWRDDGTSCWPPWTGAVVASQADPNGNNDLRHPLVVTDCSHYSQLNGQSCPVNYSGPIGCSCQPITKSKSIQSIIGHVPSIN